MSTLPGPAQRVADASDDAIPCAQLTLRIRNIDAMHLPVEIAAAVVHLSVSHAGYDKKAVAHPVIVDRRPVHLQEGLKIAARRVAFFVRERVGGELRPTVFALENLSDALLRRPALTGNKAAGKSTRVPVLLSM